jgi:hypothetical protein
MNLVILIESAQMFFRNFGFRHATAALGEFAIGLAAGPRRRTEMTATLQKNGLRSADPFPRGWGGGHGGPPH